MPPSDLLIHPAEFWTSMETIKKINNRKLCLAAAQGNCGGQIIQAHTIPRSQLERISTNGHVYCFRASPERFLEKDEIFTVEKRGIGQFSVLNFFCSNHDSQLFSHIENDELIFDAHQLALLHYRAMGAELYKKMNALDQARYHGNQLRQRSYNGDQEKREFLAAYTFGTMLGLRDMSRSFSKCESILFNENYESVSGLTVRFKRMPTIMTVGGLSPEFDYDGRPLQRLGQKDKTYEQIGLSILIAENKAAVVFTWLTDAQVCHDFVQSFIRQDSALLTTLAIQTAFEHIENTCMHIGWWDSLRPIERKKLSERMQLGGSPMEERTRTCLQFCGINFDQWEFDGFSFVGAH
jgi:hypothetical protein